MELALTIARKLLQIKAIRLSPQNPFTWASGLRSPIYCDNRTALAFPDVRRLIIDGFAGAAAEFRPFDVVAGVATAGIPHGALLADRLDLPFVYVRDKPKAHGRQNRIEGVVHPGDRVLVIEDLISTGGSSLKAVEALREAGCTVVGVLAIFSYGFASAEKAFREAGCPFRSLSNYEALLREAEAGGDISSAERDLLARWRQAPEDWSAAHA